jgi:hypothetical protein
MIYEKIALYLMGSQYSLENYIYKYSNIDENKKFISCNQKIVLKYEKKLFAR